MPGGLGHLSRLRLSIQLLKFRSPCVRLLQYLRTDFVMVNTFLTAELNHLLMLTMTAAHQVPPAVIATPAAPRVEPILRTIPGPAALTSPMFLFS